MERRAMKKVKLAIWILIAVFVAIVVYQNRVFFVDTNQSLGIDLIVAKYQTPELRIVTICFAFLVAGLLLGLYFVLLYALKHKKKVKALQTESQERLNRITELENELKSLKGPQTLPEPQAEPDAKTVVMDTDEQSPAEETKE
jgi:uncharacterized membrane protein (DUF106 family)